MAGLEPTMSESKSLVLPLHYIPIFGYPFNLCIAPALADSNGLLYVTKSYNSHSVSSLGQRLELFFNKLFSYFPLYFHLNFACSTVTIWINYFYKDKVTILWIRIFITTDRFPLIKTVLVTPRGIEPRLREWKSRVLTVRRWCDIVTKVAFFIEECATSLPLNSHSYGADKRTWTFTPKHQFLRLACLPFHHIRILITLYYTISF